MPRPPAASCLRLPGSRQGGPSPRRAALVQSVYGAVAEWLGRGSATPRTSVRIRPPPHRHHHEHRPPYPTVRMDIRQGGTDPSRSRAVLPLLVYFLFRHLNEAGSEPFESLELVILGRCGVERDRATTSLLFLREFSQFPAFFHDVLPHEKFSD